MCFRATAPKRWLRSVQRLIKSQEFDNICNVKRIDVMSSTKENDVKNENFDNRGNIFLLFVQIFLDQIATTLRSSAVVLDSVVAVPLDFLTRFRRWRILKRLTRIGFLSISYNSSVVGKERGDHCSDGLSANGFLFSSWLLLSGPAVLVSEWTARRKNRKCCRKAWLKC